MTESDAIAIQVQTHYLAEQSLPEQQRYVFAYTITLTNTGNGSAKLLSRHWIITDANNKVMEVRGYGVVGEHPQLEPGERYQYTSGTILETETGTMTGSYQMQRSDGSVFEAPIPIFALVPPHRLN